MSGNSVWRQAALAVAVLLLAASARGQVVVPTTPNSNIGGVYIDPEGVVRFREADGAAELSRIRALAKNVGKDEKLRFVSLPKVFEQVRQLAAEGKPIPEELKYLGGLTRLQYVLVFPEDNDLVIAGPGEDWEARNALQPYGKRTGRPVMQLDDLVVALRLAQSAKGDVPPFGCSIDPEGDVMARAKPVLERYQRGSRARLMEQMKQAVGPQKVTVFGAAANTRVAMVAVAADYKMKRMSLGVDSSPIGAAVDNSREAGNRFWFETSYEPLLVSAAGDAFELRGPRLAISAGTLMFQDKGATETAQRWAKRFNEKMGTMAATTPVFADLQNIADLSVLAALIRADGLDKRVGWDLGWVSDSKGYVVSEVAVPQTAETLVAFHSGSIVAGGVRVSPSPVVRKESRQTDEGGELGKAKQAYEAVRTEGDGAIRAEK